MSEAAPCAICRNESRRTSIYSADDPGPHGHGVYHELAGEGYKYVCQHCGAFVVLRADQEQFLFNPESANRWLYANPPLSALLRERTIKCLPETWLQFGNRDRAYVPFEGYDYPAIHIDDLLRDSPKSVSEKIERTLCNLGRMSGTRAGVCLSLRPTDQPVTFAVDSDEFTYIVDAIVEAGFADIQGGSLPENRLLVISPAGWLAFEEATSGKADPTNPAFVAMRFGGPPEEKTAQNLLFSECIYRAIRRAGWNAKRADSEPHSEYIMNQIIGDMRAAPFIVADFTGNNPGVYFEAGWGRGNDKTVIHICEKDFFPNIHFDIRQINCIQYTSPDDLETQLYHHVRAAMGQGPVPWDEGDKAG